MKKRVLDLAQTSANVYETIGPRRHQMTQKMSPSGKFLPNPNATKNIKFLTVLGSLLDPKSDCQN